MKQIDLHGYRRAHRWRVEETGECLFLIDVALPDPNTPDLQYLVEVADQQHRRVSAALKIERDTIKEKKRRRRVNVWLYGPEVLEQAGLVGTTPWCWTEWSMKLSTTGGASRLERRRPS